MTILIVRRCLSMNTCRRCGLNIWRLKNLFFNLLTFKESTLSYILFIFYYPRSEGGIAFSSVRLRVCVSVCLSVCLSVCQHDNSWTVRDIITKFSRHHPMVKIQMEGQIRKWIYRGAQVTRKRLWWLVGLYLSIYCTFCTSLSMFTLTMGNCCSD